MAEARSIPVGCHHYHITELSGHLGKCQESFGGDAVIVGDKDERFHFVGRVMFFPWKKLAGWRI